MWYLFHAHDTLVGRFSGEPVIVMTDFFNDIIWMFSVTGEKNYLASSPKPMGILALPQHGVLLWSNGTYDDEDDNTMYNIMKLPIQGEGSATEIVSSVNDIYTLGYVEAEDLLVWVTYYGNPTLESSKLDGSGRKKVVSLGFTPIDLVIVDR